MKKLPIYFSIDFEDFFFDTCRDIGHESPGQRKSALDKSYILIKSICKKYLDNRDVFKSNSKLNKPVITDFYYKKEINESGLINNGFHIENIDFKINNNKLNFTK